MLFYISSHTFFSQIIEPQFLTHFYSNFHIILSRQNLSPITPKSLKSFVFQAFSHITSTLLSPSPHIISCQKFQLPNPLSNNDICIIFLTFLNTHIITSNTIKYLFFLMFLAFPKSI